MECVLNSALGVGGEDYSKSMSYTSAVPILILANSQDLVEAKPDTAPWIAIAAQIVGLILFPLMLVELVFRCIIGTLVLTGEAIKHACEESMDEFNDLAKAFGDQLADITEITFFAGLVSSCALCDDD